MGHGSIIGVRSGFTASTVLGLEVCCHTIKPGQLSDALGSTYTAKKKSWKTSGVFHTEQERGILGLRVADVFYLNRSDMC